MILFYFLIFFFNSCDTIVVQMDEDLIASEAYLCISRNNFDLNELSKEVTILLFEK